MDSMNQDSTSLPPPHSPATASAPGNDLLAKRKRGRPRKDETITQQENSHVITKPEEVNLVGQMVSGVVEGTFDAGYFLNVKVKDSEKKLRGMVFLPGRVTPITPQNDLAPLVKMYTREEEIKNQTNDQPMKDAVTGLEISESDKALSLIPHESNGEFAVEAKEAEAVEVEEAATRLVEFFPTPSTMMTAQPNLALEQKEREQQKSPCETHGLDLLAEKSVSHGEKVPEELQLELGNKITLSGDNKLNTTDHKSSIINNITIENSDTKSSTILSGDKKTITMEERDPKSSESKSGFIANLFEGEGKKVGCNMEEEATPSLQ